MTKQRCADVFKKQQEKEKAKFKLKHIMIRLTMQIDPNHTSQKVKHTTLTKLRDHQKVEGWLEQTLIIVH